MKLYDCKAVEKTISERLVPAGYEIHQFPGTLVDSYICVAPDEGKFNFIFWEKYLNEWSSALTMRRCRVLPKWALRKIEEEEARELETARV